MFRVFEAVLAVPFSKERPPEVGGCHLKGHGHRRAEGVEDFQFLEFGLV